MKLKDLRQGMVCKLRNKESITVVDYGLFAKKLEILTPEINYNEDLTHRKFKQLDIMEVTYGDKVVFERKESNRWHVPEYDEKYFFIDEFGEIRSYKNLQAEYNDKLFDTERVFKTKEEAEKRLRQQQATLSVERWIAENDVEVDINDLNVLKCSLYYDVEAKEFGVMSSHYYIYMPKQFVLSSQEKAKQLIKEREKELKIMFGVEE